MQGLGGLLCLATVAIEALLSVMAAALSGFGLFFRVSFRWGHDDLLRIVMRSIPAYMKETMSHLASISKRHTRGEDAPATPSYKPFMMNGFHGVSSENPHQCLLKFMFGKASTFQIRESSSGNQSVSSAKVRCSTSKGRAASVTPGTHSTLFEGVLDAVGIWHGAARWPSSARSRSRTLVTTQQWPAFANLMFLT